MQSTSDPADLPELGAALAETGGFATTAFFACRFSFKGSGKTLLGVAPLALRCPS